MENAVYLHLKQQNFNIFVGKLGNNEIDFVAEKNGKKMYIQVCLTIQSENTATREFGNLLKIEDNYPKYVITLNDIILGQNKDGIMQKNLLEFLSEQSDN
jgi:predicted AAA+ superfamily ATPase